MNSVVDASKVTGGEQWEGEHWPAAILDESAQGTSFRHKFMNKRERSILPFFIQLVDQPILVI